MKVLGVQLDEGNVPCNHESAWRMDEGTCSSFECPFLSQSFELDQRFFGTQFAK